MKTKPKTTQEFIDNFYIVTMQKKPCCAGCDWWQWYNSTVGDCTKSAPVSGEERLGMLGMSNLSFAIGGGHIMTHKDHSCGDFVDTFNWGGV